MHSLQLIFFENWICWSQKVYPEPEILWVANAWSESKLLRNMKWWTRVTTNLFWAKFHVWNFYLRKLQNKKFLGDEKYLPEPYAWNLQRHRSYMLLVSCWALSNFVTLVSCVSYSHDRESRTHHFYMQKLPHWKNSISIPSTHAYPFWCSICHKVSSQNSLQQWHELCIQKKRERKGRIKAHEKERERWTKVHAKTRKLAMSKKI